MTNLDIIDKQLKLINKIDNLEKKRQREKENSTSFKQI